jgi:hypothetical protein
VECNIDGVFNLFIEITERIISFTLHVSKDQPKDGFTIGPKHVAGIVI